MTRKIMFVVNPVSGNGKGAELIPIIKQVMDQANLDYDFKISSSEGRVEELAAKAIAEGYTEIIAVGGDGTVTEVLNGIHGKNVIMGIIPAGTGNDFIRALNIPKGVEAAITCIAEGYCRPIDVGMVNGRPFLNVVSMGIDGQIILDFEKIKKWIKGSNAYLLSTFITIATFNPIKITIRVNEKVVSRKVALIAVGNGQYFGGGMRITPDAKVDDGLLDVCIVNAMPRFRLLKFFPTVFDGKHIQVDEVEYFKCKKIEIENIIGNVPVNSDGNLVGSNKASISIGEMKQKFLLSEAKTGFKIDAQSNLCTSIIN